LPKRWAAFSSAERLLARFNGHVQVSCRTPVGKTSKCGSWAAEGGTGGDRSCEIPWAALASLPRRDEISHTLADPSHMHGDLWRRLSSLANLLPFQANSGSLVLISEHDARHYTILLKS